MSNVLTSIITAITTGLLATVVLALVLIPVCKKQRKLVHVNAEKNAAIVMKEPIYDQINDYKKTGASGKGNKVDMTSNEAYVSL